MDVHAVLKKKQLKLISNNIWNTMMAKTPLKIDISRFSRSVELENNLEELAKKQGLKLHEIKELGYWGKSSDKNTLVGLTKNILVSDINAQTITAQIFGIILKNMPGDEDLKDIKEFSLACTLNHNNTHWTSFVSSFRLKADKNIADLIKAVKQATDLDDPSDILKNFLENTENSFYDSLYPGKNGRYYQEFSERMKSPLLTKPITDKPGVVQVGNTCGDFATYSMFSKAFLKQDSVEHFKKFGAEAGKSSQEISTALRAFTNANQCRETNGQKKELETLSWSIVDVAGYSDQSKETFQENFKQLQSNMPENLSRQTSLRKLEQTWKKHEALVSSIELTYAKDMLKVSSKSDSGKKDEFLAVNFEENAVDFQLQRRGLMTDKELECMAIGMEQTMIDNPKLVGEVEFTDIGNSLLLLDKLIKCADGDKEKMKALKKQLIFKQKDEIDALLASANPAAALGIEEQQYTSVKAAWEEFHRVTAKSTLKFR